jgi:hypothetical protein
MINPGGWGTMGVSFLKSKNWLLDFERYGGLKRADRWLCLTQRQQLRAITALPRRPLLLRCAPATNFAESISEKRPPWCLTSFRGSIDYNQILSI